MTGARILIVEDEPVIAMTLSRSLKNLEYEVVGTVTSGEAGVQIAEESKPDLVLMDINLAGEMDGVEAADRIRSRFDIPVVYLIGYTEKDVLERAKLTEPFGYLAKPVSPFEMRGTVETALYKHQMEKRLRESETRCRQILDNANDSVHKTDEQGFFVWVNPGTVLRSEYSEEELIGKYFLELIHPEYQEEAGKFFASQFADRIPETYYEFPIVTKSGETIWIGQNTQLLTEGDGIVGFQSIARDITDRKKVEDALKESEAGYRDLFDNAIDLIYTQDLDGKYTSVNRAVDGILGYSREEFLRLNFRDIVDPEHLAITEENFHKIIDAGVETTGPYEILVRSKDGPLVWIEVTSRIIKKDGKPVRVHGTGRDITGRKNAEEDLRVKTHELRERVKELNCLHGISKLREKPGISLEEITLGVVDLLPPAWRYPEIACARIILEDREFKTKSWGEVFSKQSADIIVYGKTVGALEVGYLEERPEIDEGPFLKEERDLINTIGERLGRIVERQKAEEALRASEKQLRVVSDSLIFPVAHVDSEQRYVFANRVYLEWFGVSTNEVTGRYVWEVLGDDTYSKIRKDIESALKGKTVTFETRIVAKQGESRDVLATYVPHILEDGKVHGFFVQVVDITRLKRGEDLIKASLKEKEVMLREIHHRVKNNLAVIDGLLALQSQYAASKPPEEAFEDIQERIRSMAVAHEMIYQSANLAYLDISDYIGNLVGHLLLSHDRLDTLISLEKEIEQVSFGLDTAIPLGFLITELVSNCLKHAFPERGEGKVRIALRSVGEEEFELIVSDNGIGISGHIDLENPQSMGLSVMDAYVRRLNGELEFTWDHGTEVRVKFSEVKRG